MIFSFFGRSEAQRYMAGHLLIASFFCLVSANSGRAEPALQFFATSAGPVAPAFSPEVFSYTQQVPAATHAIRLSTRPLGASPAAYQIQLNGAPARTALPGPTLDIGLGGLVLGVTHRGAAITWGEGADAYTPPAAAAADVIAIGLAPTHALALKADGSILAWGSAGNHLAVPPATGVATAHIAADDHASFALATDGTLIGWGDAGFVPAAATTDVAHVAAAHGNRAVLKTDGTLLVWGNVSAPPASAQGDILDVALGSDFVLVLKRDGSVVAWGAAGSEVITKMPSLTGRPIVAIAAGASHALALTAQGRILAWGNNSFGQIQAPASTELDVVALAARGINSAALLRNGSVVKWGYAPLNGEPDVWIGPYAPDRTLAWPLSARLPLRSGLNHITLGLTAAPGRAKSGALLAAGPLRNLAVTPEGLVRESLAFENGSPPPPVPAEVNDIASVFSGGYGEYALTTRGTLHHLSGASLPFELMLGLGGAIDTVAIGETHALALTRSGFLSSWGELPAPPSDARSGILAVASGANHALALRTDGRVVAWGSDNTFGELDVPAAARSGIVAIAARGHRNLALRADGLVVPWGQIDAAHDLPPPAAMTGVVAIALGAKASLALKSDGTVVAWGDEPDDILLPPPSASSGVVAIAAGDHQKLALLADGSVVAWGALPSGEAALQPAFPALIDAPERRYHVVIDHPLPAAALDYLTTASGTLTPSFDSMTTNYALAVSTPYPALALQALPFSTHDQVVLPGGAAAATGPTLVMRNSSGVALRQDGTVATWGDYPAPPPEAQAGVTALAANESQVLALKTDGTLLTWGESIWDIGTAPTAKVVAISASDYYGLALLENGALAAWGDMDSAPLTSLPADTADLVAISAGPNHAMALRRNGSVVTWGAGYTSPPPDALSGIVAISAGRSHSLALRADGRVVAWGNLFYGQSTVPPAATYGVVAIAAGADHNLALKADGSVVAWGANDAFQSTVPPAARSDVVAIFASPQGSAALRSDGTLVRWGALWIDPDLQGPLATPVSARLPLELGANLLNLQLTDRNSATTTRNYTLAIERVAAPALALVPDFDTSPAKRLADGADRLDMGVRQVGVASAARTFTILNSGTADLVLSATDFTGTHAADFALTGLALPVTLAPGATTTFSLAVTPGALGSRSATLRLHANLPHGGAQHLPLLATGVTVAAELAAWRSGRFSAAELADPTKEATAWGNLADPDADGLPNLLEYALLTDPKTASRSPLALSIDNTAPDASRLALTYTRGKRAVAAGLRYEVEWSDTLFADSWSVSGVTETIKTSNTSSETVVATAPAGLQRCFLRLRVTVP